MITNPKDRISSVQATLIVANSLTAGGILMLPRGAADAVGTVDAWISVLLGGLISLYAGYLIVKLSLRFPDQTFYQYSQLVAGRFLGLILNIVLIFYFIFSAGHVVRIMAEVVRMYILESTPIEIVIIVFMSVGAYLAVGGINPIARICELFSVPIGLILLVLLLLSFQNFEWDNLKPVMAEGAVPVFKGIWATVTPYTGFEIMLIMTFFMAEPNKAVRSVLTGIGAVIPFYVLVVILAIGNFTVEEVKTLTWPTMSLAHAIEFPGAFFERFDSFLVIVWIMAMYTSFVPFYYFASLGTGQLFRKDHCFFIYALLPAIYIAAMYPHDLKMVFRFSDFISYISIFVVAIVPISLWLVAKARGLGNVRK